jgi:hypothetical protein
MQKTNMTKSILATLALILAVALTSCTTWQPEVVTVEVVKYRDRPIPDIAWPTVPDPADKVVRMTDGRVAMPLIYWLAVTRYIIDAEAGIEIIEASREAKE